MITDTSEDIHRWRKLRRTVYSILWLVDNSLPEIKYNANKNIGDAIISSNLGVPLKGLAIGNGWIDARHQYPAYLDYAVKHDLIEETSDVSSLIVFKYNN